MDSIFPPVSLSVQLYVLCVSMVILHFLFHNAFPTFPLSQFNPLLIESPFPTYPFLKPCYTRLQKANLRNLCFVIAKLTFVNRFSAFFYPQKEPQTLM